MITNELKCDATGKRRYPTPGDAKRTIESKTHINRAKKRNKKGVGKSGLKRYYHCPHCKGYHLTSWEYKPVKSYKREQELYKQKTKGLIITPEEALKWKKNSLPFPKI